MDFHQLNDTAFLALWGLILTNAMIGSTAIPHLVDKYVQQLTTPAARAPTITRARRLQLVMLALQVLLACTVVHCGQKFFKFALGAYVSLDALVAIRVNRQAAQMKNIIK